MVTAQLLFKRLYSLLALVLLVSLIVSISIFSVENETDGAVIGAATSNVSYKVVRDAVGKIKFENANIQLGEGRSKETDRFVITLNNAATKMTVRTKASKWTATSEFNSAGQSSVDSNGFLLVLQSISGNSYVVTVSSASNRHALSHVEFEFAAANVESPNAGNYSVVRTDYNPPIENDEDETTKVNICHIPPGNPENALLLNVSINALKGHFDNNGKLHNQDFLVEPVPDSLKNAGHRIGTAEECGNDSAETEPDFSIFANCIDTNSDSTYTAHFGYLNRKDEDQALNENKLQPDGLTATLPTILAAGRHDRAFSVSADASTTIVWVTAAGNVHKTATASIATEQCNPAEEPGDGTDDDDGDGNDNGGNDDNDNGNGGNDDGGETGGDDDDDDGAGNGDNDNDNGNGGNGGDDDQPATDIPVDEQPITGGFVTDISSPETVEVVNFNNSSSLVSGVCTSNQLSLNGVNISADNKITLLEYSLDDGGNWYPFDEVSGLGSMQVVASTFSPRLKDQKYVIKYRVQTASGKIFYSAATPYVKNCSGKTAILGNYYRNGYGNGILNADGNLLYNSELPLEFFVETLGGIDKVELQLAKSLNELASSPTKVELSFNLDTSVWSAPVAKEQLGSDVIYTRIVAYTGGTSISKDSPDILNLSRLASSSQASSPEIETYKVYSVLGTDIEEYAYAQLHSLDSKDTGKMFNLPSGEYIITVELGSGGNYYSNKIELAQASVVEIDTSAARTSGIYKFIDPLLNNLPVKIYTHASLLGASAEESQAEVKESYDRFNKLIADADLKSTNNAYTFYYWNRWNPFYSEELTLLEELNGSQTYGQVVVYSDELNRQELERVLRLRESKLQYMIVEDTGFLNREFAYQPELTLLNTERKTIQRLRQIDNIIVN